MVAVGVDLEIAARDQCRAAGKGFHRRTQRLDGTCAHRCRADAEGHRRRICARDDIACALRAVGIDQQIAATGPDRAVLDRCGRRRCDRVLGERDARSERRQADADRRGIHIGSGLEPVVRFDRQQPCKRARIGAVAHLGLGRARDGVGPARPSAGRRAAEPDSGRDGVGIGRGKELALGNGRNRERAGSGPNQAVVDHGTGGSGQGVGGLRRGDGERACRKAGRNGHGCGCGIGRALDRVGRRQDHGSARGHALRRVNIRGGGENARLDHLADGVVDDCPSAGAREREAARDRH